MPAGTIFMIISILALVTIVAFVFLIKRSSERKRLSPLTGVAFAFIIAGMLFEDNRFIGYALLGVGIIISVIDIIIKAQHKEE
ncbi:hypothetical protein JR338_06705 [Chloroflexota bacterium]|nr:hypothetical protein JR338_06705 [Chloroflexota bacterium]